MFTGIVAEAGVIEKIARAKNSIEMTVRTRAAGRGVRIGDSVAVNGCCLTAAKVSRRGQTTAIQFDVLQESWKLTNFQFATPGSLVNIERPLHANGELGGHFVSGHVDGLGKIIRRERAGGDHLLAIAAPQAVMRYLVYKGSVAVDGISLTVAVVKPRSFQVWIIPHTLEATALRDRRIGDAVNLEADLLAKYVDRLLAARRA